MKTAKKMGVSGAMLSSVREAEASLARRDAEDLEKGIPEGHPLRDEANKQKALLGDLGGLPPGHPLMVAMQAAKDRYEQQQAQKTFEQTRSAEVRKATKVDVDKEKKAIRIADDEKEQKRRDASKQVNIGIEGALGSVKELYRVMSQHEELLNIEPISRARVSRLKRLLFAAERGLSECRITRV